jgi:hypothetical protein
MVIFMPGYIKKEAPRVQARPPGTHPKLPLFTGASEILIRSTGTSSTNSTPKLDAKCIKGIQQTVGSILYYARVVNMMLLMALSSIAVEQTKALKCTLE